MREILKIEEIPKTIIGRYTISRETFDSTKAAKEILKAVKNEERL